MKVTVTIEPKKDVPGRLRLRWMCPTQGRRRTLALGLDNSSVTRAFAVKLKDRIEKDTEDLNLGYYDPTLLKYKPRTIGKNRTEITTVELFDKFTQHQYKYKGLAQSSIKSRYEPVMRMLEKHLKIQAANVDRRLAVCFADVCADTLTAGTAKARIMLLKSAWDWGKDRYHLADDNPWVGLMGMFKAVPTQPPATFTKDEVKRIIQGFRDSCYYAHYADFVVYRFGMGTRGGEASALKWKHISKDFRSIWIGESCSRGVTGTTKTKKDRTVVMPDWIAAMLKVRKDRLNPQSDDELVFTTAGGLQIPDKDFCRRAWKTVLADVGVPYRRPYTTRKTAGNHAVAAGANPIDVAAALGHDPRTFYKYYAEAIQKGSVFVSFE